MKGVENVLENNEFHAEDSITWKPISLTYIEYQTGNKLLTYVMVLFLVST